MKLKKGYRDLLRGAEARISGLSAAEAIPLLSNPEYLFVDLRVLRELGREGKIPGAFHCPRGMLEFWIDPDCAYYKEVFSSAPRILFYCHLGLRSALATSTAMEMGLENVCHLEGGFAAWKKAGGPVEQLRKK